MLLLFATVISTVSCAADDPAEERVLTFYALGPSDTLRSADRPVAVGSTIALIAVDESGELDIEDVSIQSQAIFERIPVTHALELHALSAGTTEIEVVTTTGKVDRLVLEAAEPVAAELTTSLDLGPFSAWIQLGLPPEELAHGLVLLPSTSVLLRAELFDSAGRALAGYRNHRLWGLSDPDAVHSALGVERVESMRLEHADAHGETTLTLLGEPAFTVESAVTASASELRLHPSSSIELDLSAGPFDPAAGANLVALAFDDRGRLVLGVGEQGVDAHSETTLVEVSTLDPQMVLLTGLQAGEGQVSVTQLGAAATLSVVVR